MIGDREGDKITNNFFNLITSKSIRLIKWNKMILIAIVFCLDLSKRA